MNDDEIKQLLDGPVEDVKTRIEGKSHDDLLKVRAAEQDGPARADVLLVVEAAITVADAARAQGVVQMDAPAERQDGDAAGATSMLEEHLDPAAASAAGDEPRGDTIGDAATTASAPLTDHHTIAADLDGSGPANISDAVAFLPSGAVLQSVHQVDRSHPAVDANPRANTTANMNRIDFNHPTKTGAELAADQLEASKPTTAA